MQYRSAMTGRYVSKAYAEKHPDITVSEEKSPTDNEPDTKQ